MRYLIAYDYEPENPNPHPWQADPMKFDTVEQAVSFAESEDEDLLNEGGYEEEELTPWIIVSVKD